MNQAERVILITGGTRGIGAAIARKLAGEGALVVINGRKSTPEVESLLAEISGAGGQGCFFPADVRDEAALQEILAEILRRWGRLDGLVCAAGQNIDRPFLSMKADEWQQVLDINLTGTFLACQAAAPALKASQGAIITFAAQTAYRGRLNGANYCAAKAGVVALTKCVAQELAPKVRANVIVPGLIETQEVIDRLRLDDPQVRAERVAAIPLKRLGQPEEVAEVASFLLSPRAAYITGQVWWVNGGNVMY